MAVRIGDPKLRTQTAQVGKDVTGSNLGYGDSGRRPDRNAALLPNPRRWGTIEAAPCACYPGCAANVTVVEAAWLSLV
jgi:hypothetical protein